jgi:hypothetical protein
MRADYLMYKLACGHIMAHRGLITTPALLCGYCRKDSLVTGIQVTEYHVKCANCTFSRWCGLAEPQARFWWGQHDISHRAVILYEDNPKSRRALVKLIGKGIIAEEKK